MQSIRTNLVKTISLTITGVVVAILLATDLAVDTWIDNQFNKAMQTKVAMLMTLIDQHNQQIEFHFSAQYLPEFAGDSEPEYYQIWLNSQTIERSASLELFREKQLPLVQVPINKSQIKEQKLPDGRDGRIIYQNFLLEPTSGQTQQQILIAYATGAEGLNFVLWLIDIVFIVTVVSVVIFIRIFVRKTVDTGLQPLYQMNEQIEQLSLSNNGEALQLSEPIAELIPVEKSLNTFINENRQLYLREKRLTSDISHELKTPITELINLAEVIQRFPEDNELNADFAPEVLRISTRLKHIVTNVLMLHKYENCELPTTDIVDLTQLIQLEVLDKVEFNLQQPQAMQIIVQSNQFALETIIKNLLKNALIHRKAATVVNIDVSVIQDKVVEIRVKNHIANQISQNDLPLFFEPLWQQDKSRSSTENFGLGLPIAKTFAEAIGAQLTVSLLDDEICFVLSLDGVIVKTTNAASYP